MKSTQKQHIHHIIFICLLMVVGWGQCIEGEEVELWGVCYNIEETTELDLSGSGLHGEIPPEIGNLTNLEKLYLNNNYITGNIPPEIGNLTNLEYLYLNNNWLYGDIPIEIGNLSDLIRFNIENNYFHGLIQESLCDLNLNWSSSFNSLSNNRFCPPFPDCINDIGSQNSDQCSNGNCIEGEEVSLWGVCYNIETTTELTNSINDYGIISPRIGELINLTHIDIGHGDDLIGPIPREIGNLTELEYLDLRGNNLCGYIPEELWSLTNLVHLDLEDNKFFGPIPNEIGNLTHLEYLNLRENRFFEQLPTEIVNLSQLIHFGYGDNNLSSNQIYYNTFEFPSWIYSLINLEYLYLSDNPFTGEISQEIQNLINLQHLDLSNNELTGEIPSEIGQLTNLNQLYLDDNQLNGLIPEEICNQGDNHPTLMNNQLCPPYPECMTEEDIGEQDTSECEEPSLCNEETEVELWEVCYNIEETTYLDLSDSNLTGEIPPEIGNLINLNYLNLSNNQLTGNIPSEIGNLIYLETLILGSTMGVDWISNQLTGSIPSEIGNLVNLYYLSLSNNLITGNIPSEIGNLENLGYLSLKHNQLTGEIPPEIGNLLNLENLNLSNNQFVGDIPSEIGNLFMLVGLYLSNNQLMSIPNNLDNLTYLFYLGLNNNQITYLPESICNFSDNVIINFSFNYICSEYPQCIDFVNQQYCEEIFCPDDFIEINNDCFYHEDLDFLEELKVTNESLNSQDLLDIGEYQFWNEGRLSQLYLGGQGLTSIPNNIENLENLKWLRICDNELSSIPESIGNLENLITLDSWGNNLNSLPESIGNLTNLNCLSLFQNQLTSIPESLGNLDSLQTLLLNQNQLTSIPESVGNLSNLQSLWLNHNQLISLPDSFHFYELYDLRLYDNYLTDIPYYLIEIDYLNKYINLQNGSDIIELNNGYGNNLVSYTFISNDTHTDGITFIYNQPPNFILGQGVGLFFNGYSNYGYEQWSGNLSNIEITSGYWINLQEPQESISILEFDNSDVEYNLGTGNNLISYPKKQPMSTLELPEELLDITNFILGQGQGLFKDSDGEWSGNLSELNPNKGYWINVDEPITFQYPQETTLLSKTYHPMDVYDGIPKEFHFFQSTEQSFYLINNIELNNQSINSDDYVILSYNNNELTGSGLYTGNNSTIVTMGKEITEGTEQFHQMGDTPTFKLYNKSTDELIPLYGDVPSWTSNNFQEIELLKGEEDVIPEEYEFGVSVYPNPFNPTTTINVMLSEDNLTEVKVYDIQGKHIITLMNQQMKQGHHQIEWNGENLSSGTYFIRINSGEFSDVKKVVLVK